MTDNLHQLHSASPPVASHSSGSGANSHVLHGRVCSIEARLDYLATKKDIRRAEALISQREASLQCWMIGLVSGAALAVTVALIRTFVSPCRRFPAKFLSQEN